MQRLKASLWIFDIGFRRMNADLPPGWAAEMGVFSALALAMIAAFELRVPIVWPLALIGAVDLVAVQHFVRGASRRIRMLGIPGPTRARWWIEAAALSWTLCMGCGVLAVTHGHHAAPLPAWQGALLAVAWNCAGYMFVAFLVLTIVGFLLGMIQGKRIRGRSLELVSWFFWSIVIIGGGFVAIPEAQALTKWIAPTLALVSIVPLIVAGVLWIRQRGTGTFRRALPSGQLGRLHHNENLQQL